MGSSNHWQKNKSGQTSRFPQRLALNASDWRRVIMDDEFASELVGFLESLAKTFVIAQIVLWIFQVVSWPFVVAVRILVFVATLGFCRLSHERAMHSDIVLFLALILFISLAMYLHIVYGAKIYGNES